MRLLIQFARRGRLCYVSHLDVLRTVQRTVRRTGIEMVYSQGFNPHPLLSFAQALGVGLETVGDYFALELAQELPIEDFIAAFNRCAPMGLQALAGREMRPLESSPMALVQAAQYRLEVEGEESEQKLIDATKALFAAEHHAYMAKGKQGLREEDMREKLIDWQQGPRGVLITVCCGNQNLAPGALKRELCAMGGLEEQTVALVREQLLTRDEAGELMPLLA